MDPPGIAVLAGLATGLAATIAGFVMAGNIGMSPALAYSAGAKAEAGLVQPSTPRRAWGARLRLVGLLLIAVSLLLIDVAFSG